MADIKLIGNDFFSPTSNAGSSRPYYLRYICSARGLLKNIQIYVAVSTSLEAKVAIYSDNAGDPGNVLAQSGSTPISGVKWNTINLSDVSLNFGSAYWLAFIDSAANGVGRVSTGGTERYGASTTYATFAFSDNPTGLSSDTRDYLIAGWGSVGGVGLVGDGLVGNSVLLGRGLVG